MKAMYNVPEHGEMPPLNTQAGASTVRRFPQLLLTIDQLAESLNLSAKTVYRLTKDQGLPAIRFGRSVRYRLPDVENWLKSGAGSGDKPKDS